MASFNHPELKDGEVFIVNAYNIVLPNVLSTLFLKGVRVGRDAYQDGQLIVNASPIFAQDPAKQISP